MKRLFFVAFDTHCSLFRFDVYLLQLNSNGYYQDEDFELPMTPITMLRNALGKEEGGSGVPLDKAKYAASVAYWSDHVTVA
jgi:hypothetical protein